MSGFTNCDDKLYLNKNISLFCDVFFVSSVTFLAVVHDSIEMCWFYGHCPNSFRGHAHIT